MAKQKFYVVWEGVTPGIYTSWTDCQLQIKGYEAAKYKSFDTREEAERALTMSPYAYIGKNAKSKSGGSKPSSGTDGVSWSTHCQPSGNFSFRPDERHE